MRQLRYAEAVMKYGPRAAGYAIGQFNSDWAQTTAWAGLPYLYPPLAFFFFVPIAAIWSTVFAAKLALTLIEAVNALLCWKITGKRWIAVLYFACPISIWYASREGQYEPVQNLLAMLAIYFLPTRLPLAIGLLILAVQTKITSGALLPLFLYHIVRQPRAGQIRCLIVAAIACLPGLIALHYYPWITNLGKAPLPLNSYFWNPWGYKCSGAHLPELILHQTVSYLLLIILIAGLIRSNYRIAYVAPLLFIIFIKTFSNMMGWYMIVWVPLVLPIRERWVRTACLLVWPFMDIDALIYGPTTLAEKPLLDQIQRGMLSVFQKV